MSIIESGFDTRPIRMETVWQVTFQAPTEDIDRVFEAVAAVAGLEHGKTDRNGYRAAAGFEYYRPLEGTPTGAETEARKRPDVEEMRFFIPRDETVLNDVIEAIYEVHSYYEPVITVVDALRSSCKGLDDSANPHRWWNKGGDWKVQG
ncbi:hypothetical protein [Pacificispira spongiicola]|uniref:hypothetical protein n=1 Tax=Pacificispira spongiicola TaxID=2729598 RepID=UPI001D0C6B1E|nr:hypothetical protein [Pacificispira spongiicola]